MAELDPIEQGITNLIEHLDAPKGLAKDSESLKAILARTRLAEIAEKQGISPTSLQDRIDARLAEKTAVAHR